MRSGVLKAVAPLAPHVARAKSKPMISLFVAYLLLFILTYPTKRQCMKKGMIILPGRLWGAGGGWRAGGILVEGRAIFCPDLS